MEAEAAAVGQAPLMGYFRRNLASTVIVWTLGTLLIAGGADWSRKGIQIWAYNKVNTNVSVPLTNWQLEVRMHWVEPMPLSHATTSPATIHEYFRAYPLRTKLYSVGLMCSPRWALMWAWVFERDTALKLLHQHIVHHQDTALYYTKRVVQLVRPQHLCIWRCRERWWAVCPLRDSPADAAAAGQAKDAADPIMQFLQSLSQLKGSLLFWLGWFLVPGLHSAYYALFFASQSPVKAMYGVVMGLARTAVELRALYKCIQAVLQHNKQLVRNSLICCYALPVIMTVQSLSILLLMGLVFPYWLLHTCVVAFCLWGPPAMIALMTTAWQPERHRPLLAGAAMGLGEGAAAAAGAVDAVAALVAPHNFRAPHSDCDKPSRNDLYWPKPLTVPEEVEEQCNIPHYFICSITHSIMLEPAVTATGATYERAAILEWLRSHKRDPLTSRELHPNQVSPNLALYRAIDDWVRSSREQLKKHRQQKDLPHHQQQDLHCDHCSRHSSNWGNKSEKGVRGDCKKSERGAKGSNVVGKQGSMEVNARSSRHAAMDADQ